MSAVVTLLPRLIRLRDAPEYLGMDKNRYNAEVRPLLTEIPVGVQGIAFDRLELDAWADQYIKRNGRKREAQQEGGITCQNAQPVSRKKATTGRSTSRSGGTAAFAKALEQATLRKQNGT
jgi:hypothetical protein